jgi:hypothetical protein
MKVDKLDGLMNPLMADNKKNTNMASGVDFQKFLSEAQANRIAENQQPFGPGLPQVTKSLLDGPLPDYSLPPISELAKSHKIHEQAIRVADRTLGVLEQYQKAMADPKISLKKLYPYIQSLSHEIKDVTQVVEGLPASNPLKKVLGEIGVLGALEVEKFNRGDYIS